MIKEKIAEKIWQTFLVCMGLIVLFVIAESLRHPIDYLTTKDLLTVSILYPCFFLILVLGTFALEKFLNRYEKIILPVFLVLYGAFLYWICSYTRCNPLTDSKSVYEGALYVAGLGENIGWNYFSRCHNNIMPMLYLSVLFRIGHALGFQDVYCFAVLVNVLGVLAALYCVFRLGKGVKGHEGRAPWVGIILLGSYFPILGHTASTYTDAFSFCWGIVGFTIWHHNLKSGKKGWKYALGNLIAALVWGIGMQLKTTAIIPMIAVSLYCLLFMKWKQWLANLAELWIPVLCIMFLCGFYCRTLPCEEYHDTWEFPLMGYFVGLGLEADGAFHLDSPFMNELAGIYGYEEKSAFATEFIKQNWKNFFDRHHVVAKLAQNFSSGTMKDRDFLWDYQHATFVTKVVTGEKMGEYQRQMTRYWLRILCLVAVACFAVMMKRDKSPQSFVALMSVMGIMAYCMIGEANNRQLYNHLSWIMFSANVGLWGIVDGVRWIYGKLAKKKAVL